MCSRGLAARFSDIRRNASSSTSDYRIPVCGVSYIPSDETDFERKSARRSVSTRTAGCVGRVHGHWVHCGLCEARSIAPYP